MIVTMIQCDGCGDRGSHQQGGPPRAHLLRTKLRTLGWLCLPDGRDYCPECRPKTEPKREKE